MKESNIPTYYSGYDGIDAKNYAYLYYEDYNTAEYSKYPNADCTNFVSQCLKAGGLPTDGTWYKDRNAKVT